MTEDLTGINGTEVTPEERARWRKERRDELRRKQDAEKPALKAWNSAFDKPKSHRKRRII